MNSIFKSYNYKLFVAGLVALAPLSADAKTAQADETDSLNADKEMVQVAYRQVAKDELLGGVSVVDVEDLMKKDYHTYSLDNMQALVGGWNGNSLCAPVTYNAAYLSQLKDLLDENCILTDVGSVKTSIHEEVIRLGMEANFIGGHPMAGSEKSGFMNSKAHLIENAYYILTPSAKVAEEKVDAYKDFVSSLKALPVILDYHEHDHITGTISHLPHIIASTLVNFVHDTDSKEGMMKALAAGGFKDITRIASSSPVMWQQICLKNSENISQILGEYIEALSHAKDLVDEGNEPALYALFENSKDYRNSMPNGSAGPIKKQFALYCDIIDETGGIATIATILASNNISIKNIGIIHNREFEEGVLRIEFYDEDSANRASVLLQKYRYVIYEV